MIKIELNEGRIRIFSEKKKKPTSVKDATKIEHNARGILYGAIKENRKQRITFEMILCNSETCVKILKMNKFFWENVKEDILKSLFEPRAPKYFRFMNYLFGVNEESARLANDEFIFLMDCRKVSEFKKGKLWIIKEANYGQNIRH